MSPMTSRGLYEYYTKCSNATKQPCNVNLFDGGKTTVYYCPKGDGKRIFLNCTDIAPTFVALELPPYYNMDKNRPMTVMGQTF